MKDRTFERGTGCWNCLAKGTLLLTQAGPLRIEEASQNKILDVHTALDWQEVAAWGASGQKPVFEVVTSYGQRLRASANHQIHTERGWIEVGDLRASRKFDHADRVMGLGIKQLGHQYIEPKLLLEAELFGAITGDGWIKTNEGVGFGFKADRLEAWNSLLGYAGEVFQSREKPHFKTQANDFYQLEWRTKAARAWSQFLDKQHTPNFLWWLPPEVAGAYLRGLFSTDGTLGINKGNPTVAFFQTSRSLIDEVQLLMRTMGINSHCRTYLRDAPHKDLFCLQISQRPSILRFRELIGFNDARRTAKLAEVSPNLTNYGQIRPEHVIQVNAMGEAPTFDIEVPATSSFFANGILVHNCSKRFELQKGKQWWIEHRAKAGAKAVEIALTSTLGEQDSKVVNTRRWIDMTDVAFSEGRAIHCEVGRTSTGEQVGDVTPNNYLCEKWVGLPGSSLAKIDGRIDMLPEELLFKVDGGKPTVLENFKVPNALIPADSLVRRPRLG